VVSDRKHFLSQGLVKDGIDSILCKVKMIPLQS